MISRALTYQQQRLPVLKIILSKASYFVDEYIDGKVEISSSSQIVLSDVLVSLNLIENWISKGKENDDIGDSNNKSVLTMYLEIKKQLKIDTNLISLSPGKFTFPFLFRLPKDVTGCFEYTSRQAIAYIRYSLSGQIVSPYIQGNTSTYVLLKSRPVMQNTNFNYSASSSIHKWGLFSKGSTTLNINLLNNKDSFISGETINFNIEVDNSNGELITKQCKFTFIRHLILKSKYGGIIKEIKDDCISKIFDTPTNIKEKKNFPGSFDLKNFDNSKLTYKEAKLPYVNITDINFFLPSVNSLTIECKYILKATLYFNNFVKYDERPRIMIPIYLRQQSVDDYNKEIQNYYNSQNNINNSQIYNNNNNQYNNINQIDNNQINNYQNNNAQPQLYKSKTIMDYAPSNPSMNQNIGEGDNDDLPSLSEIENQIEKPNNFNETGNLGAPSFDVPVPCFFPKPQSNN